MAPRFTAAASTVVLAAAGLASARDVPQNVRDFYNTVVGRGQCDNVLASGFHSVYGGGGGKHPLFPVSSKTEQPRPSKQA